MTLAFYAPLKPPTHPTPSGDRQLARNLITALETAGFAVALASTLRSRDGDGDVQRQKALIDNAATETPSLIARGRQEGWQGWITYHNYYKAPDLLGPKVCAALKIPYVQIESTRARKRLTGPWARFAQLAEEAANAAHLIFYLTDRDAEALRRDAPPGQQLAHLPPFLPLAALPPASHCDGPMLSVGMLRKGDKMASYQLIAQTLPLLRSPEWALHIAGDGEAADEIKALFAPFGANVRFLGAIAPAEIGALYRQSALLLWPGVNEAFGMTYLEAQAHGLAVVAQNRPGVRDVLAEGEYPIPDAGAPALAGQLDALLQDHSLRQARGEMARAYIRENHLLAAAAQTLKLGLARANITP